MSATVVISQLRGIVNKANLMIPRLANIYPTDQQWESLETLSEQLVTAANQIKKDIRESKDSRGHRAWKESEKLRNQALACKGQLLTTSRLKQPPVFRRNIVTIFEGPKISKFDSEEIKARKVSTLHRCEQIRQLSPSGVVSWAISYAPSLWAAGEMPTDIFNCLLDDIEPDSRPPWPSIVGQTLHTLQEDDEALQKSSAYQAFLRGCRKRKHLYSYEQEGQQNQGHPSNGDREMQHIYTNSDPACINKLPKSFQTAVMQSQLWQWERRRGMETTGCLSTLFPKDNTQDVSLTIWCGNPEAYNINDEFGLQLAASS
ncbi:hypothetical protein BDW75DRAFT_234864 [Aspergillus navahoensis]